MHSSIEPVFVEHSTSEARHLLPGEIMNQSDFGDWRNCSAAVRFGNTIKNGNGTDNTDDFHSLYKNRYSTVCIILNEVRFIRIIRTGRFCPK